MQESGGPRALNLDGRVFRAARNSENGEVGAETVFHYRQEGPVVAADYSGGAVLRGHLLGRWREDGRLEFAYHHLNTDGVVMAGRCVSEAVERPDGRILLKEEWQWFTGDRSAGSSEVLEVLD